MSQQEAVMGLSTSVPDLTSTQQRLKASGVPMRSLGSQEGARQHLPTPAGCS